MVDNQHKKISGYRDLDEDEIGLINTIKMFEVNLGSLWREVGDNVTNVDRRWMAVARTHFEEGFSALVRSIARPEENF